MTTQPVRSGLALVARHLAAAILFGPMLSTAAWAADPPGDHCGVVKPAGGASVSAADALMILKTSVAGVNCVLCDVDNNGTTATADALRVLKKAVGQSVTLTCGSYSKTPCTQSGLASAITSLNGGSQRAILPNSHIVFDCEDPGPISIDENWTNPALTRNGLMIAGTGRGIEFQLSPLCYNRCLGR